MRKLYETKLGTRPIKEFALLLLVAALSLTCVLPASAQKDKKKKLDPTTSTENAKSMIPMTDEQQIDYMLSEMLASWQLGDIEKLHSNYADDVTVVNGSWAPPVFGWNNYLAIYQQQRARMLQVRMDRSNTYIKVDGTVAWACYQWDFGAVVDGQQAQSQGQTTVVLEKRNNRWVIVLNHTSLASRPPQATPAATPTPADKPATDKPGLH